MVYYVASWLQVTTDNSQAVSFAVPTGNFGNILAGHVARQMGVPIHTLLLATNENSVLDEFYRTGVYRVRVGDEVYQTSSPSMDISKASNFERFIYELLNRDAELIQELFGNQLSKNGCFDLSERPEFAAQYENFGFQTGSSTHNDRIDIIRLANQKWGIFIDPHTADALKVALDYADEIPTAIVIMETALPVKFAETMTEALGKPVPVPSRFAGLPDAESHVIPLPNNLPALKNLIIERVQRPN